MPIPVLLQHPCSVRSSSSAGLVLSLCHMASTASLLGVCQSLFLKSWRWAPHRGSGSFGRQMSLSLVSPVRSLRSLCWVPCGGPGSVGHHIPGCPPPDC
jgi:hypothetical protein